MAQNRVKELRTGKNLTQSQFADSLITKDFTIEPDTIGKVERNERKLSPDLALRISQVYGVSLDWLNCATDVKENSARNATTILAMLQDTFKLRATELTYEFPKGMVTFPYFQLTIGEHLNRLLNSVTQAEIFKRDKDLPEEGYRGWVEGSKREYDKAMKNKVPEESSDWILLPADLFTQELIGVICEDYFIKSQEKQIKDG